AAPPCPRGAAAAARGPVRWAGTATGAERSPVPVRAGRVPIRAGPPFRSGGIQGGRPSLRSGWIRIRARRPPLRPVGSAGAAPPGAPDGAAGVTDAPDGTAGVTDARDRAAGDAGGGPGERARGPDPARWPRVRGTRGADPRGGACHATAVGPAPARPLIGSAGRAAGSRGGRAGGAGVDRAALPAERLRHELVSE